MVLYNVAWYGICSQMLVLVFYLLGVWYGNCLDGFAALHSRMPFVCVDSAIRVCVRDSISLPSQSRLCPSVSTEYGVFLFCTFMLD